MTVLSSTLFPSNSAKLELLIKTFDSLMLDTYNTILIGGAKEPLYQPSDDADFKHRVFFTRDYFSSALHEIAHWCVAGESRRLQEDYGYWYAPDGRSVSQQSLFESVEIKPQALEWIFSVACNVRFSVSADNLESEMGPSTSFVNSIIQQARFYCEYGLPNRAKLLADAFSQVFSSEYLSLTHSCSKNSEIIDSKATYLSSEIYNLGYFNKT